MSILETDRIDAMGISNDEESLRLMLSDHLDWENEAEHLYLLQDKINAYLSFIESNQYAQTYPDKSFKYYIINVMLKHEASENCLKFVQVINKQLREYNIQVVISKN